MDIEQYLNYKIYSELLPKRSIINWFHLRDINGASTGGKPVPSHRYKSDYFSMSRYPPFVAYESHNATGEYVASEKYYKAFELEHVFAGISQTDVLQLQNKNIYINHSHEPISPARDSFFWNNEIFNYHKYSALRCNPEQGDRLFLLHSERSSDDVETVKDIITSQQILPVYWFANGYVASVEWFKKYNLKIFSDFESRPIRYKYVCATRLFSETKSWRLKLLNQLDLSHAAYSLLERCPTTGQTPNEVYENNSVKPYSFDHHSNESAYIELRSQTPFNTSFLHVVMETLFEEQKHHLTEKIFKPIVLQQPFVLVAPRGSLGYLKSYGFRTFDYWWDESYDNILDPDQRLQAIADVVNSIAQLDYEKLYHMRTEMTEVLEHYHRLFYGSFASDCWHELKQNLKQYYF